MIISNIFILKKCFFVSIMTLIRDPEKNYWSPFFLCTRVLILILKKGNKNK